MSKTAIIIGAGPAGLTAAYELIEKTDVVPLVLEATPHIGGLSRTARFKGNRMDIGGHRFFSKSATVMKWWLSRMPLEAISQDRRAGLLGERLSREFDPAPRPQPELEDRVMLCRDRKSRILYLRKLFAYPLQLTPETLRTFGPWRTARIGWSYAKAMVFPIRDEKHLADFFTNRFGKELYETFFKSYTEKVWGVPCEQISPKWGAQRIKGLSITKAALHFAQRVFRGGGPTTAGETSLIELFLYPKLGPGQLWEYVADEIRERGGRVLLGREVVGIEREGNRVVAVRARSTETGELERLPADYVISTMPVKDLVLGLEPQAPSDVRKVAQGLTYRDFVTVGVLAKQVRLGEEVGRMAKDNWVYVQEPDVLLGRIQFFHNWSPYLVNDQEQFWLGLEYFCNEGDDFWNLEDAALGRFAAEELVKIGVVNPGDVLDTHVVRVPKAYPAYFGTYDQFDTVRGFLDAIPNLYLVGRNGMHRYNNQDHSMLAAMEAVACIRDGRSDKTRIWTVNTEQEYHEERTG